MLSPLLRHNYKRYDYKSFFRISTLIFYSFVILLGLRVMYATWCSNQLLFKFLLTVGTNFVAISDKMLMIYGV